MSENFSYEVKFQRRKTLVLYVLDDGSVEVRAPYGVAHHEIVRFVETRAAWVLKTRALQQQRRRWQTALEPGATVWFLGETFTLEVGIGTGPAVLRGEGVLRVEARDPFDLPLLARMLNGWYREQALDVFSERLVSVCARFPGIETVPELRVRKMRRRWGSCNRGGRITLNSELVKLPPALIDYVIAHELCHLFEFNHGRGFYRLLQAVMPEWKQHEALLKQF